MRHRFGASLWRDNSDDGHEVEDALCPFNKTFGSSPLESEAESLLNPCQHGF